MPYTFTLTAAIPASPREIYEAWLDSLGHSEMTGGEASMSDVVGADVSAWDGYISGRNLELIPGERIVQSWRTSEFADEHEDSVISIVLAEVGDGTLLTLEHSNVPDGHRSYEEGGWQSNYFEPMVVYFAGLRGVAPADRPEPAARQTAPKAPPKRARKRPAKTARKTKSATKVEAEARGAAGKGGKKENQRQRNKSSGRCYEAWQKRKANGTQIGPPQTKIRTTRTPRPVGTGSSRQSKSLLS